MDIDGTYTLQAPPEVVWNLLMDQDMLQHTIQGMERLGAKWRRYLCLYFAYQTRAFARRLFWECSCH